ncbi:MAG: hypothetical protein WAM28_03545 [Chlamydiales bacterium]
MDSFPQAGAFVQKKLDTREFHTLEIRYTAEEIMAAHKQELLKRKGYNYLEPKLMFYPYLLMDVKYSKSGFLTGEGILLWSLTDGEMVIDTTSWEQTHGYEDCLLTKVDKNDIKILKTIIEVGGAIDRERLYQKFKVDHDILDDWIESCKSKKLIVMSGNQFRLHFENPRLEIRPVTHLHQAIVTQPAKYSLRMKKRYTPSQIMKLSQIIFGNDFAIRKTQEVFLPVYIIAIQNPDGSLLTTHWNALNGKPLTNFVH